MTSKLSLQNTQVKVFHSICGWLFFEGFPAPDKNEDRLSASPNWDQ